jgi:type IV pilus biogenesis protein PilP
MTHQKFSLLLKSVVVSAVVMAGAPAQAQDAPMPPESQLQTPGVLVPAQGGSQPSSNGGESAASDPCPQPDPALVNAPDDLAKVQEEIDRFTLCVQRAQLVERLNDSAVQNMQASDKVLGLVPPSASMMPGVAGPQQGLMPLPSGALAGADVAPQPSADAPAVPADTASADAAEAEEPEEIKDWTIKEISGTGSNVHARLLSPEGDEVKASNGMKLPDGKTTVIRITPGGVTIRADGETKSLEWARS